VADLIVGLSSWIVMDGNYSDFTRGKNTAFALEFYAPSPLEYIEPSAALAPSLTLVEHNWYEAVGQVVHRTEDWWVVDAGFLIFREESPPANARVGNWLRGKVWIGIDPFFYFERLAREPCAPAMIYDWKIEKIEMETGPFIEIKPRVFERDPAQSGLEEIAETNAGSGEGDYLLHCNRVDGQARKTRNL
jgi:hypothetical protein